MKRQKVVEAGCRFGPVNQFWDYKLACGCRGTTLKYHDRTHKSYPAPKFKNCDCDEKPKSD